MRNVRVLPLALGLVFSCGMPMPVVDEDAGTHDIDAGLITHDAGLITEDAGSGDAGVNTSVDAGSIDAGSDAGSPIVDAGHPQKKIFVITFENQGVSSVYGSSSAPYINGLMTRGGHAAMYGDVLAALVPSEPHYVWMEAGTNVFADHTFTNDHDASSTNSTASTQHLVNQLEAATPAKTWRAYQQGLGTGSGACPISSSGQYAVKHDPFVFFQDVSGNPPSKSTQRCVDHHRAFDLQAFEHDLSVDDVADYTFITPDLCNDMHGGVCSNGCVGSVTLSACVSAGDAWLSSVAPVILTYLAANDGVLLIVWDEPTSTGDQPFVIVGRGVKPNFTSTLALSHSSYLKSLQEWFGVPVFSSVQSANDFADFFEPGAFP